MIYKNEVLLLGDICQAPSIKTTSMSDIARPTLATKIIYLNGDIAMPLSKIEYHKIVAFGEQMDAILKLKVRDRVEIKGRLQTRKWKSGSANVKYITEIVAISVKRLSEDTVSDETNKEESLQISSPSSSEGGFAEAVIDEIGNKITQQQKEDLWRLSKDLNVPTVKAKIILQKFGFYSSSDITQDKYAPIMNEFIAQFKEKKEEPQSEYLIYPDFKDDKCGRAYERDYKYKYEKAKKKYPNETLYIPTDLNFISEETSNELQKEVDSNSMFKKRLDVVLDYFSYDDLCQITVADFFNIRKALTMPEHDFIKGLWKVCLDPTNLENYGKYTPKEMEAL